MLGNTAEYQIVNSTTPSLERTSVVPSSLALQAILRHVNFQQIKCLLLGSPGFVKDDFVEYLNLEAVRRDERVRVCRV